MTEEFVPIDAGDIEAGIREFIDAHGIEGFLILYYRQLFFRFVKRELESADDEVGDVGTQMHVDPNGDEAVQQKREQMKRRCERWARELVSDLKQDEQLRPVFESNDPDRLGDDVVKKRLMKRFDEAIQDWKDEDAFDDDQPDSQTTLSEAGETDQ